MKNNFMFDVAFTVEGPWELPEDVPPSYLLLGLQTRLASLHHSYVNRTEDITEAFGFCDQYEITEENDMP